MQRRKFSRAFKLETVRLVTDRGVAVAQTERTSRKVYRMRDDTRIDVFDCIERVYNPRRGHSTLGYMSAIDLEGKTMLA